jgi:FAD binding domain/Domain of unknown function (DUF4265)
MTTTPAGSAEADPTIAAAHETVCLRFPLTPTDGWPAQASEDVAGVLVAPRRVRLVDIPLLVDGFSLGDVLTVAPTDNGDPDEPAPLAPAQAPDLRRGRHSTIRVVAAERAELDAPRRLAEQLGCTSRTQAASPVLAIDVPESVPVEDVLVLLDSHCTATLTYVIACLQHRITPTSPGDLEGQTTSPLDPPVRGRVIRPDDEDWDTARTAWNLAVDQRPALVVEVADAFDVQAVVRWAGENGLRVAPQGTGHQAAPLGDLGDAVLLRTGRLSSVEVDLDTRTVRVGSGALWADVAEALAPHGLAALAGSSPDVGVAGYCLGGGYSWLGRSRGLAVSSVTAVELVTGDGAFHRVDADNEPELFWAVRGAGANVGVVCALELEVYPIPDVYAGALLFPLSRASEILAAYEEWTRDLDEAATTCIRLLRVPPLPNVPEPLRGNAFVMIDGAIDADDQTAESLLSPLRGLGPVMDSFARMPSSQLSMIHMDPPQPVPAVGDGLSLVDLTPGTIDVLIAHAGAGARTSLLTVDLRHLGGALGRPDPRGGLVDQLPGRFLLYAVGIAPTPEAAAVVDADVQSLLAALEPWCSPLDYLNFREVSVAPGRLYPEERLYRARALCDSVESSGRLVANHPLS